MVALICGAYHLSCVFGNELLVGNKARTNYPIPITISDSICLNFKGKDDIFKLRKAAIDSHASLHNGAYVPSEEVFGQVESEKPWWGLYGAHIYGQGQRSIEGPSKEGRFVLNPYLLVAADPSNVGLWNTKMVTKEMLADRNFPFYWKPQGLTWYPREAKAEVTYDVTGYQRELYARRSVLKFYGFVNGFSLIAYNARDLGFNYLFLSPEKSKNVVNQYKKREPIEIQQMVHLGESCGYPGGCNNMSPYMPELDHMVLTGLPAHAHVLLWKQKPPSVSSPADMVFDINFK